MGMPPTVNDRLVDPMPGDAYFTIPGYTRLVAVRRAGKTGVCEGWLMVRTIPSLSCGRAGCGDRNCEGCADTVLQAVARGFTFAGAL